MHHPLFLRIRIILSMVAASSGVDSFLITETMVSISSLEKVI